MRIFCGQMTGHLYVNHVHRNKIKFHSIRGCQHSQQSGKKETRFWCGEVGSVAERERILAEWENKKLQRHAGKKSIDEKDRKPLLKGWKEKDKAQRQRQEEKWLIVIINRKRAVNYNRYTP